MKNWDVFYRDGKFFKKGIDQPELKINANAVSTDESYQFVSQSQIDIWDANSGGGEPVITKDIGYATWDGSSWIFLNEHYSLSNHDHDALYASIGHDHNLQYADIGHSHSGYLTEEVDPIFSAWLIATPPLYSETSHADVVVDGDFTSEGLMKRGASSGSYSIITDNSIDWDTAYGWGDHAGLYSLVGHAHALDDLTDVIILAPAHEDVLKYNGTDWVNGQISTGATDAGSLFFDDGVGAVGGYNLLAFYPLGGAEVIDAVAITSGTSPISIKNYVSATLDVTSIDPGIWEFHTFTKVSNTSGTSSIRYDVYKRTSGGTETLLFSKDTGDINSTVVSEIVTTSTQPSFVVNMTDRIVVKVFAVTTSGASITVSFYHNGADHYSHIHTPMISRELTDHMNNVLNPHSTTYSQVGAAPTIHNLIDITNHPVAGLTTGHFLKATGATSYAFGAHGLTYSDVGAADSAHVHALNSVPNDVSIDGPQATMTAGENLVFGEICYIKSDGKAWKADATAAATLPALIMAGATISANATGTFLFPGGFARNDAWNWSLGLIWASLTSGAITQTMPTATDEGQQIVGIATNADRIFFYPQLLYTTHV